MVSNSEVFTEIWSNVPQTVPVLRLFKISLVFRPHPHSRQSPRGDWNRPYFIRPQRVPLTRQSDKGSDKIWYKSTAYWPKQNTTTWYCSGSSAVQRWDENERLLKSYAFLSEYWNWNTVLRRWMFHSLLMHWQSRLWLSGWQLVGLGPGSKKSEITWFQQRQRRTRISS